MKFWAKLKFKKDENAEDLIRNFFKQFNPKSSIIIIDDTAEIEIHFDDKPPMEIIESLVHYSMIEFRCGQNPEKNAIPETELTTNTSKNISEVDNSTDGSKVVSETEESDNGDQLVSEVEEPADSGKIASETEESDNGDQLVSEVEEPAIVEKSTAKTNDSANSEISSKIPELNELAEKASSFENFVILVGEWLNMSTMQKYFEEMMITATGVENISWKALEDILLSNGKQFPTSYKTNCSQRISKKVGNYYAPLDFIKLMVQYKDFFKLANTPVATVENSSQVSSPKENLALPARVKMNCMLEIKSFEETLANIDKTQSIELRVSYVLNAMGLNALSKKEQTYIKNIAIAAVQNDNMEVNAVLKNAKIPASETRISHMQFSQFINDFAKKHKATKPIKLIDFLSDLKKVVVF